LEEEGGRDFFGDLVGAVGFADEGEETGGDGAGAGGELIGVGELGEVLLEGGEVVEAVGAEGEEEGGGDALYRDGLSIGGGGGAGVWLHEGGEIDGFDFDAEDEAEVGEAVGEEGAAGAELMEEAGGLQEGGGVFGAEGEFGAFLEVAKGGLGVEGEGGFAAGGLVGVAGDVGEVELFGEGGGGAEGGQVAGLCGVGEGALKEAAGLAEVGLEVALDFGHGEVDEGGGDGGARGFEEGLEFLPTLGLGEGLDEDGVELAGLEDEFLGKEGEGLVVELLAHEPVGDFFASAVFVVEVALDFGLGEGVALVGLEADEGGDDLKACGGGGVGVLLDEVKEVACLGEVEIRCVGELEDGIEAEWGFELCKLGELGEGVFFDFEEGAVEVCDGGLNVALGGGGGECGGAVGDFGGFFGVAFGSEDAGEELEAGGADGVLWGEVLVKGAGVEGFAAGDEGAAEEELLLVGEGALLGEESQLLDEAAGVGVGGVEEGDGGEDDLGILRGALVCEGEGFVGADPVLVGDGLLSGGGVVVGEGGADDSGEGMPGEEGDDEEGEGREDEEGEFADALLRGLEVRNFLLGVGVELEGHGEARVVGDYSPGWLRSLRLRSSSSSPLLLPP
jgi:hypothetical protein